MPKKKKDHKISLKKSAETGTSYLIYMWILITFELKYFVPLDTHVPVQPPLVY